MRNIGAPWAAIYLAIALPTLLALCFMTQVFHSLDEPAHFLRIVQLSKGELLPVLGPDQHSTGSYQKAGIADFASFYGTRHVNFMQSNTKTSRSELAQLYEYRDDGPTRFVEHSNTTIYLPAAYLSPLVGIVIARQFSDRPLVWFYAARISSAIFAVVFTALGLLWACSFAPVLFVIAVTPIVMFQAAALSADGLLVALTIVAAGLTQIILSEKVLSKVQFGVLTFACVLVGLSKFAYYTIAVAPIIIFLLQGKGSIRNKVILSLFAVITLALAFYWSAVVKPLTFTVRQDAESYRVNVDGQVRYVIQHPLTVFYVMVKTMLGDGLRYAISFSGGILGWFDLKLPAVIPICSAFFLIINVFFGTLRRFSPSALIVSVIAASMSVGAIFLLLYLQWNNVGSDHVIGVQGRYFIPLAPLLCVCLPRRAPPARMSRWLKMGTIIWGAVSAIMTMTFVTLRYWAA